MSGETILGVVEAAAGGRLFLAGDGDKQLELQVLLALGTCQHATGAPEEGVVRHVEGEGQLEIRIERLRRFDPGFAEGDHIGRLAQLDELMHAEALQPRSILRGLAAEAPAVNVE